MTPNNITIAIVGHTNTGKTSLVRALTRQRNFGEVKNAPATTIDVTNIALQSANFTFNFVDTPGLEDAMSILELIPNTALQTSKQDEKKALLATIGNPEYQAEFDQEFKVLNQMLKSDIAFYVIDVRQPFLPRYHYELLLLLKTHIPILPILNFTQDAPYIDDWKRELKANGLHHYLEFDTILLPRKQRLYEQIAIMFPEHYHNIQDFIQAQNSFDEERSKQAMLLLATFYLDLMTLRIKADIKRLDPEIINQQITGRIRKIEYDFMNELLELYQFNREDIQYVSLNSEANATTQDMFTLDEFGQFSIQFGKGAAAGATLMAGVDLVSGFTTLGAASATGAVVGGVFNSIWNYGERLVDKWRDIEYYYIDQPTAVRLMLNYLYVIERLNDRSHAQLNPIIVNDEMINNTNIKSFIKHTENLRAYPEFHQNKDAKKQKVLQKIVKEINTAFNA